MPSNSGSNKRIAKNTLALYVRMLFLLGTAFYTSRVILSTLGVVDFGIYNVVGGVVALFGFISTSLGAASSRFITYALGVDDESELRSTFGCVQTVHYLFAGILLLLAETVGLWFVLHKLVIPPERLTAALFVYQGTVLSAVVMLASAPYNALIIAHERMSAFAYISIFDALAKLGIVLLLPCLAADRLIAYALMLVGVQIAIRVVYTVYCHRHFPESHHRCTWEKQRVRRIFAYAGWVLNGNLAVVGFTQGINVLLNLYFGPAVNAARGISVQVQAAVTQFTSGFQTAVRPQITKTYARGEFPRMHQLVLSSSRIGSFLMLAISLPVVFRTDYLLGLWLTEVPEHTAMFVRIMLLGGILTAMRDPTLAAIHATGRIRRFQVIEGTLLLSVVPVAWLLLKFAGISPEGVFIVYLSIEALTQVVRVGIVYPRVGMKPSAFLRRVAVPLLLVAVPAVAASWLMDYAFPPASLLSFLLFALSSFCATALCAALLGTTASERALLAQLLRKAFSPWRNAPKP